MRHNRLSGKAPLAYRNRQPDQQQNAVYHWSEIPMEPTQRQPLFGPKAGLQVDVAMNAGAIQVQAKLPGINPADVEVTVTGEVVILRGSHCRWGHFEQAVHLPAAAVSGQAQVEVCGDLLTIRVPVQPGAYFAAEV